jgi:UPF0755 protein
MKPRRLTCFTAPTLLALVALVALAGLLWALGLPARAAATFGMPAAGLSTSQRLWLAAQLLWESEQLTQPVDAFGKPRPFKVDLGEPVVAVAGRLQAQGLIRDAAAFRTYLIYSGKDTTLQAGAYELSPAMSSLEIAHALQDATPDEVTLVIFAGWRLEEIAASLPTSGLAFSPADFIRAARWLPPGDGFFENLPESASLEGFLFPGSYALPRQLSAPQLVRILLESFASQLTPEIQRGFERQGLSLFEAVTLASIVEREAVLDDEMPAIASVFFNRLAAGMPLDADSTVQYALGYNRAQGSWWTNPLSAADLRVDSPYNTYRVSGLPPGPVANPGLSALRAVAFPAKTPYFYFRAACDGSGKHLFAQTYPEHLANACR